MSMIVESPPPPPQCLFPRFTEKAWQEPIMRRARASPYRYIMVFDTETTGLIKRGARDATPLLSDYPHITQLCFLIYDVEKRVMVEEFMKYLKLPADVSIEPMASQVTGITDAVCANHGVDPCVALLAFYRAYQRSDCLVAHNFSFDRSIIDAEIRRRDAYFRASCPQLIQWQQCHFDKDWVCTMKTTIRFCDLPRMKYPKLQELYNRLFGEEFRGAHDAGSDALACLRCYLVHFMKTDLAEIYLSRLL